MKSNEVLLNVKKGEYHSMYNKGMNESFFLRRNELTTTKSQTQKLKEISKKTRKKSRKEYSSSNKQQNTEQKVSGL